MFLFFFFFFFQAEDGIRDLTVTGVQTCALPISRRWCRLGSRERRPPTIWLGAIEPVAVEPHDRDERSEEHTSELQSQSNLVCRLLLEKKKKAQVTDVVQQRRVTIPVDTHGTAVR